MSRLNLGIKQTFINPDYDILRFAFFSNIGTSSAREMSQGGKVPLDTTPDPLLPPLPWHVKIQLFCELAQFFKTRNCSVVRFNPCLLVTIWMCVIWLPSTCRKLPLVPAGPGSACEFGLWSDLTGKVPCLPNRPECTNDPNLS